MEGRRNYIPSIGLNPRQNSTPFHYIIGDRSTAVQHQDMQSLVIDNQCLQTLNELLKVELSAAQNDLRHLSSAVDEVKAERDAEVRQVYDRAMMIEAEVRVIDESKVELAQVLADLQKLRSEKNELDVKLNKLRGDVEKVSFESHQIPIMKDEIETMQKEIRRGREVIEHEKRVYAINIEESKSMEKWKMFMGHQIEKLQVEVIDATKRARAAAAAEAASIPGTGYEYPDMAAATTG